MNVFALACACACSLAALLSLALSVLRFARPGKYWRFDSARTTFWEELRPSGLNKLGTVKSVHLRATPSGHPKRKGKKPKWTRPVKDPAYDKDVGQISRTYKLIFVHVPKTGGSTIEQSKLFYDAKKHHPIGGHTKAEKLLPDALDVSRAVLLVLVQVSSRTYMRATPTHRGLLTCCSCVINYMYRKRHASDEQFSRRNLAPGFRSFSMVRHPCERFISAFTYTLTSAAEPELRWHHTSLSLIKLFSRSTEIVRSNRTLQGLKSQLRNIGNRTLTAYVASSDFGGAKAASEAASAISDVLNPLLQCQCSSEVMCSGDFCISSHSTRFFFLPTRLSAWISCCAKTTGRTASSDCAST